ncbi:MAG: hypothetical protein LBL94_01275 [Prevotellaceae bacterium]|jgi:hypothetical protein|nr:hypothetical protein [Prevotellaceae bacterium]
MKSVIPTTPRPVRDGIWVKINDNMLVTNIPSQRDGGEAGGSISTNIPSLQDGASVPRRCSKIIFGTLTIFIAPQKKI